MSTLQAPQAPGPSALHASLARPRLPRWAPAGLGLIVIGLAALLLVLGVGFGGSVALGALTYLVLLPTWSAVVEGSRAAVDRLVTSLVWGAFAVAMIPLVWLLWTAIDRGSSTINLEFLTFEMRNVIGDMQGGIYHALIGTLLVTLTAAVISVPIGVFTAIYVVEYGKKNRLSRLVTFLVDVMTGIPSIVAGLFALALFVLLVDPAYRSGFAGSVALSLLMIPTVVRSTEEMLRLVPEDLREASYALGVPKWRTITKVVLPTAFGGIVTGVVLAVSRVIGETAPLLIVAGVADSVNTNVFSERMQTLPVFIYYQYGLATDKGRAYAWGGALVLILLVMLLNLGARVIGRIFAPKKG
ncbi:phosphate ABC transporter permease PstA [Nocardioides sp. R-C-SC26]|uniref:phosphate ABC transporter permease PstA n=1 Tax=Nocardioides sp. R-C-SC26 TaxID=2870414 RepID=UPI001E2DD0BB|nr:phosphate ABC transporter permease PstA [Nocardioides sp. R-C-SC26]